MIKYSNRYKSHHDAQGHYSKYLESSRSSKDELEVFLDNNSPVGDKLASVYFHIPFCDKICSFCNLNRGVLKDDLDKYVNWLIERINWYGEKQYVKESKISSVYFGGGTPTVMYGEHFEKIIEAVKKNFNLIDDCEISVETTLHNLTLDKLSTMENVGINRLSIGIQTFSTAGRKFLNRTYSKEETIERLKSVKENFDGMVGIDKIYNYPGETIEDLEEDIRVIKELNIESISFYSLMIHEGSALSKHYENEDMQLEQDIKFHDHFVKSLLDTGEYETLELTKIVKKNTDNYQYIQVRNNRGDVFPIGKGAGGNIDKFGIYQINEMMMAVQKDESDNNALLNGVYGKTQKTKFNLDEDFKFLDKSELPILEEIIEEYVKDEYIVKDGKNYSLTEKGLFFGNNVSADIVEKYYIKTKGDK